MIPSRSFSNRLVHTTPAPLAWRQEDITKCRDFGQTYEALTLCRPLLPWILGSAIKHHMPDRFKTSFVIFDIRAL